MRQAPRAEDLGPRSMPLADSSACATVHPSLLPHLHHLLLCGHTKAIPCGSGKGVCAWWQGTPIVEEAGAWQQHGVSVEDEKEAAVHACSGVQWQWGLPQAAKCSGPALQEG